MSSSPSDFKQAIGSYRFPKSEPIFSIDLNYPRDECLVIFRAVDAKADSYNTVADFWASVLFNYLEDRLEDERFEELGEAGECRDLSEDEARRVLAEMIGTADSNDIAIPRDATSCFLVHDSPNLRSLVGSDSRGFFAVFSG